VILGTENEEIALLARTGRLRPLAGVTGIEAFKSQVGPELAGGFKENAARAFIYRIIAERRLP